jgi:hypothetical protein
MNPRRIHELMRAHFPPLDAAQHVWTNVANEKGRLLTDRAEEFIAKPFTSLGIGEVLVQVNRSLGGKMALPELVLYLARHLGEADIRVADRQFTAFAMLARSGVSARWRRFQPSPMDLSY